MGCRRCHQQYSLMLYRLLQYNHLLYRLLPYCAA
jgi:hypothetical protein